MIEKNIYKKNVLKPIKEHGHISHASLGETERGRWAGGEGGGRRGGRGGGGGVPELYSELSNTEPVCY